MANATIMRPCLAKRLPQGALSAQQFLSASSRTAQFSTTPGLCKRKRETNKDRNKSRGVSSLYGSGPKESVSMSAVKLPKPRDFKPKVPLDKNHGLWEFFPEPGKLMWAPEEMERHGRSWTMEELRRKSFEDLHSLWWICCKERNRISTSRAELERSKMGFGDQELEMRDDVVKKTMNSIKHTLIERQYVWEDAVKAAREDPEVNMSPEDGEAYNPSNFEDEPATLEQSATQEDISATMEEPSKPGTKQEKQAI